MSIKKCIRARDNDSKDQINPSCIKSYFKPSRLSGKCTDIVIHICMYIRRCIFTHRRTIFPFLPLAAFHNLVGRQSLSGAPYTSLSHSFKYLCALFLSFIAHIRANKVIIIYKHEIYSTCTTYSRCSCFTIVL